MKSLIRNGRILTLAGLLVVLLIVYIYFLYDLQIVQGEIYYNRSNELITTERTMTAARGNILDRYGRVLVSNKECYNLKIDMLRSSVLVRATTGCEKLSNWSGVSFH